MKRCQKILGDRLLSGTLVENTETGVLNPIRILEITVANLMMITAGDKHKCINVL